MAQIHDDTREREHSKFVESPSRTGESAVEVVGNFSGSVTTAGLSIAGKFTEVTIDDTTWTALPSTPLADRNSMSIQNRSGFEIKVNYDNTEVGYKGMVIPINFERFYEIRDTVVIYAKAAPGSGSIVINVEEIS